jgi:esterase/lipase superfamily enzyme
VKTTSRWYSERLGQEVSLARWGTYGKPVLLFPTAGGDAEEVERFHLIDSLSDLLESARIKVYSCDSVGGKVLLSPARSDRYAAWVQNQFHHYVYHEVVPAIRADCQTADIEVITTGASLGALNALSVLCRFPDVFSHAICMSGTYNLDRFLPDGKSEDLYYASPLHFLPDLNGSDLEKLRQRFVILASGEGRAEDIGESWRVAHLLGTKGIPNRVDPWGPEWHHDWPTWRHMLPLYLQELA